MAFQNASLSEELTSDFTWICFMFLKFPSLSKGVTTVFAMGMVRCPSVNSVEKIQETKLTYSFTQTAYKAPDDPYSSVFGC